MSRDEFGVPAAQHPIPPDELLPLPMHVGWLYLYSEQSVQQVYGYTAAQTQAYAHANCRPLREKVRALEGELAVANGLLSDFGFRANFIRNADDCEARAEAVEAENAKLREALVDLESWMGSWHDLSVRVGRMAADAKEAIDAASEVIRPHGCDCPGFRRADPMLHAPNCPARAALSSAQKEKG